MAASDLLETKTLTAQCYCKAVHFTIEVPTSKLPLGTHLCHCSICRYTHGTLCIFHAPLPEGIAPKFIAPSSIDKLTSYVHSKSKGKRYFCSTCGCQIGDVGLEDPNWVISASIFDQSQADMPFVIRSHVFSKSVPGGGLANWLPQIGDRAMRDWNPDPKEDPEGCEVVESKTFYGANGEERLLAQCHCGGVSFSIPRPTEEIIADPKIRPFLSPIDKTKWAACLDLCDDCRLQTATHVVGWTFVPRGLLEPAVPESLLIGTAKNYVSSDGVLRSFCGTCGATVLYSCDDRKYGSDQVVDVTVGILRAPEGPLAEEWLTWRTGRVGWMESGKRFDEEFARSLAEGMAAWGKEKYGEAYDFDIGG
jgi:hypothetical protein